jgi:hypothetical protein
VICQAPGARSGQSVGRSCVAVNDQREVVAMPKKVVHGDDLLYRFFQSLFASEPAVYAAVPRLLIESLAVWLPLDVYERFPVLLPWVVRDPSCRGSKAKGVPDQWGSPNDAGYLRDDNSLVKALPRNLAVRGPKGSHIHGARMGTEFVASHIWRRVNAADLASRVPLLNTFVPNLVWLPSQVAKLSDVEGGVVQQTLQALSRAIYGNATVEGHLRPVVEAAWSLLPPPAANLDDVDLDRLNWFVSTPGFFETRSARLSTVLHALHSLAASEPLTHKVITTRYGAGLHLIELAQRDLLAEYLTKFTRPD